MLCLRKCQNCRKVTTRKVGTRETRKSSSLTNNSKCKLSFNECERSVLPLRPIESCCGSNTSQFKRNLNLKVRFMNLVDKTLAQS